MHELEHEGRGSIGVGVLSTGVSTELLLDACNCTVASGKLWDQFIIYFHISIFILPYGNLSSHH